MPIKDPRTDISDEIKTSLKTLVDMFDKEDDVVRQRQIRMWKRLSFMWKGESKLWWNDVAHDWRVYDDAAEGGDDQAYYDKTINVFRAYLESIIAAMSATVPGVRCKPDDADNVNDVLTAKGGTKISELIYSHNDAPLLWSKALFIYCTQGMIAGYNYTDKDKEYGLVKVAEYKDSEETKQSYTCPKCGQGLDDLNFMAAFEKELQESDEYDPGPDDVPLHDLINQDKIICENCQEQIDPELKDEKITVTRMVGMVEKPKARQIIQVEGGLFVKVPNYARVQKDIPYLSYCYETHFSFVYDKYPFLRKDNKDVTTESNTSGNDIYERWGRLSPQYNADYPVNTPTVRNWWLRPSSYQSLDDEKCVAELKKKYPDGCKVVYINDELAEACNEALDDHWTLTYNPLSEFIHFDPLGLLLTSIQEITNDLVSLTLQTIEQGIPQTFADPAVLNFKNYRNTEVSPGAIFPARPKSGKGLGDAFYEVKVAALSPEVGPFGQQIQQLGQMVSGAMPSLFGGDSSNSSRTASQYAMSRAQSLQRLQTPWKMLTFWWKNVFGKVIPAYIKDMMDDERIVKPMGDSWLNVVIKKSELEGKIGEVELEAADDLPMTTAQVRDLVMQLFNLNNPAIQAVIASPSNLPLLSQAFGLNMLHIPGEDDREKQLEEIQELLQGEPQQSMGPQDPNNPAAPPQPIEMPSVMPELLVDSHDIEADICRVWLVGEAGRQAKVNSPNGYKNVLLHMKMHIQMMMQMKGSGGGGGNPSQPGQPSNPTTPPGNTVAGPTTQAEQPKG